MAVDQHLACPRQLELGQQADDRRFAGARVSDQCDDLTRLGDERDAVQHRTVRHVGEGDVAEFDMSLQRRALAGRGLVRPSRRRVEQAEVAFGSRHRKRGFGELRADDRDRREEQVRQEEERHQVSEAGARARERRPAADADERGHKALGVEFEQRQVEGREARGLDHVAGQAADQTGEDAGVGVLAGEALRHADALDRLGKRGGHAGEGLLLHA